MKAERASTLGALRHGEFRYLFLGLLTSNIGNWMQQFALGWLVVQLAVRDGNPSLGGFYLGLRSLASAVPALGFGLFAGVIADRTDRRTLLIATRIASAAIAAVLAILVITDHVNIWIVMICSAVASAAFSFDPPSRQAMLPDVVPMRDLFSAMGLTRASMQTAQTIGPLIAGLLMVPIGVGGVILTKTVLFFFSVAAMLPMKRRPVEESARKGTMMSALAEGISFMRHDEVLRWTTILFFIFAILATAFTQLLPAVAVETLDVGPVELSWLNTATGVGALVGAFAIASVGDVERRGLVLLGTMIGVGVLLSILGLQREIVPMLLTLAALGFIQQLFFGMGTAILQLGAPDRLRGRVMGMQSVIFMTAGPAGVFVVGSLGSVIGVSNALFWAGLVVTVTAVMITVRAPVLRSLRGDAEAILAEGTLSEVAEAAAP